VVFWGSSCRETAKNAIKTNQREKTTGKNFFSQLFRPKVFDMDFSQNVLYGVFELPLLRNTQKRQKNLKNDLKKRKKGTYLPHLVVIGQVYVAFKKKSLKPLCCPDALQGIRDTTKIR
jgi:hypothetical protein